MAKRPVWVITALDLLDFHENRIRELGQTATGRPSGFKDGWSIRNTAEINKMSVGKCHNLLIVARALKKNPLIRHATSFNAAIRLAKKEQ